MNRKRMLKCFGMTVGRDGPGRYHGGRTHRSAFIDVHCERLLGRRNWIAELTVSLPDNVVVTVQAARPTIADALRAVERATRGVVPTIEKVVKRDAE